MAQLLVRNLNNNLVERLKTIAKAHHRSLQGEIKSILEAIANLPEEELLALTKFKPQPAWPVGFLESFLGSWQGAPMIREPQGEYEIRDELK